MEKNMKINCWEFKECPNEIMNNCPAYINKTGKRCWVTTGTKCEGIEEPDVKTKLLKCHKCEFYIMRKGIKG